MIAFLLKFWLSLDCSVDVYPIRYESIGLSAGNNTIPGLTLSTGVYTADGNHGGGYVTVGYSIVLFGR